MSSRYYADGLVTCAFLRQLTRTIVEAVHPEKVILFGAYAYGEPTIDSDIDLLVVMKSDKRPVERARAISELFRNRHFGMDVLVRTPAEVKERLRIGDYFIQQVMQKGKVLNERRINTRMGRRSGIVLRR